MIVSKTIAFPLGYIPVNFYYQLDFFIPAKSPDLISFKKTYLEKNVILLNFFLLIVYKHLKDIATFELVEFNKFNFKNACHLVKKKKLLFLKIAFKMKILFSI